MSWMNDTGELFFSMLPQGYCKHDEEASDGARSVCTAFAELIWIGLLA
jgi:hypothetical protein